MKDDMAQTRRARGGRVHGRAVVYPPPSAEIAKGRHGRRGDVAHENVGAVCNSKLKRPAVKRDRGAARERTRTRGGCHAEVAQGARGVYAGNPNG